MDDYFIMKKLVDKSSLCQGISIPVLFQPLFYEKIGHCLNRGESTKITILLDGIPYDAKLTNESFDKIKYPGRSDILRILYSNNASLKDVLRSKFIKTWDSIQIYSGQNGSTQGFSVESGQEEYMTVFATPVKGTIVLDCISNEDYQQETRIIRSLGEFVFETLTDENAFIETSIGFQKIRHLSKSIGNSLKKLYGYRCQICGEYIGEKYGSTLIHSHHIDYFTKSLNNNAENIMIVCPNHHSIIHDRDPVFDFKTQTYKYPNGYVEKLLLNKHIF